MENSITEKKKEKDKTERERQTFYRVTFKNNCNLLQIADNKANIIISINALVISSTIAILGYGSMSHLISINSGFTIGPIVLFLAVILTSTMLAVQAAKPSIIGKAKSGTIQPKSSLMFFGESSKYSMEDYLEESRKMLGAKETIQDHMSISLYYQGKVLDRKYKLIRKSYEVFVLGLALGILIFIGFLVL
ncbi:Pycsar system effector family protein [Algoriphagus sp. A40]|uniref:Pycsar system effector family protein n=1 Tax=Algoriphagus sp. A40 TaxID=1945863 RepID=UPI0009878796|nr:Pycsar system effector family protein [Algoriphagus sp. A40]OOG78071.1 metal-dependent phosphohydrolase [Algoriphagus sp. A40]